MLANVFQLGFLFGTPRTLTVRAATNCKLVMLENYDLQTILPQYPLLAKYTLEKYDVS